ncbi:MAG: response regulator [Candidatus Omnitrophica bacterium]|nr:response regulator [Candidatus Omnitrophota bacterium]
MAKKKIMIVDDEEDFAYLVKTKLETVSDYEVRMETDGSKAYDLALNFRPNLIILDISMPKTDGGEVARKIMSDDKLKDTKIIFLTGLISEEDEVDSLQGIVEGKTFPSLAKPVSIENLMSYIKEALKG